MADTFDAPRGSFSVSAPGGTTSASVGPHSGLADGAFEAARLAQEQADQLSAFQSEQLTKATRGLIEELLRIGKNAILIAIPVGLAFYIRTPSRHRHGK